MQTSDASFTDPHQSRKGEADVKSLKECMALADTLQYACHALESNIDVLLVLQVEAIKRKKLDLATQAPEYEAFFQTLENVLRQLQVYKKHVVLLSTRLERTTAMVRGYEADMSGLISDMLTDDDRSATLCRYEIPTPSKR